MWRASGRQWLKVSMIALGGPTLKLNGNTDTKTVGQSFNDSTGRAYTETRTEEKTAYLFKRFQ